MICLMPWGYCIIICGLEVYKLIIWQAAGVRKQQFPKLQDMIEKKGDHKIQFRLGKCVGGSFAGKVKGDMKSDGV